MEIPSCLFRILFVILGRVPDLAWPFTHYHVDQRESVSERPDPPHSGTKPMTHQHSIQLVDKRYLYFQATPPPTSPFRYMNEQLPRGREEGSEVVWGWEVEGAGKEKRHISGRFGGSAHSQLGFQNVGQRLLPLCHNGLSSIGFAHLLRPLSSFASFWKRSKLNEESRRGEWTCLEICLLEMRRSFSTRTSLRKLFTGGGSQNKCVE